MAQPLMEATAEVRERIAAAARALFADRGYHSTTVDAIAEQAGIARRTFFRYFRSKDEAIFPHHDRMAQSVSYFLHSQDESPPVEAICAGARIIFLAYVEEPAVSIERYRVAHSVQALRDREIASVNIYIRMFSRYLRERFEGDPDADLHADVAASAVVAAHNQVLRAWLHSGGDYDPLPKLDAAFTWVIETFEGALGGYWFPEDEDDDGEASGDPDVSDGPGVDDADPAEGGRHRERPGEVRQGAG